MKTERPKRVSWIPVVLAMVIFWPVATLILFIYIGYLLKDFLKEIQELSIKAGILEFTARRIQKAASSSVATSEDETAEVSIARQPVKRHKVRTLNGSHILWVDDIPSNNTGERKTFEQMGIRITISTSTEDALEKLKLDTYDAIISDMGRPPDSRAGYTLLRELQRMQVDIPFVIYSGSNLPEHKAKALRKGAVGATNNLQELIGLVEKAMLEI